MNQGLLKKPIHIIKSGENTRKWEKPYHSPASYGIIKAAFRRPWINELFVFCITTINVALPQFSEQLF